MVPRDFLKVAGEWAIGTSEAEWRSAVSRAYYVAFHVARILLERAGFVAPGSQASHAYVWLRFSNAGRSDVMEQGRRLNVLRQQRGWADYQLNRALMEQAAVDHVHEAMTIIQFLDELGQTPEVLQEVIANMRVYERDVLKEVTWCGP
jgi:uncharacterized protein (UPF0332 family)